MPVWMLLAVVVALASYAFYRYATRPIIWKASASDLRGYLERLFRRGYDGSFVVITEPQTERFIQFSKYIKGKGNIGLVFSFPLTTWSETYYKSVEDYLNSMNIEFRRQRVSTEPTREFLEADCGGKIDLACQIASATLVSILKVSPSARLTVWFSHLSLHDELVDDNP